MLSCQIHVCYTSCCTSHLHDWLCMSMKWAEVHRGPIYTNTKEHVIKCNHLTWSAPTSIPFLYLCCCCSWCQAKYDPFAICSWQIKQCKTLFLSQALLASVPCSMFSMCFCFALGPVSPCVLSLVDYPIVFLLLIAKSCPLHCGVLRIISLLRCCLLVYWPQLWIMIAIFGYTICTCVLSHSPACHMTLVPDTSIYRLSDQTFHSCYGLDFQSI